MELIIVLGVCSLLLGIGFWQMSRQKTAARAAHWTGVIVKLDESDGLKIPKVRTTGVNHIQKGRHVIHVFYRRDDGVEGHFFVGEPGDWKGWNEEPGKPDYTEVRREWEVGRRLDKPAGQSFPRLC